MLVLVWCAKMWVLTGEMVKKEQKLFLERRKNLQNWRLGGPFPFHLSSFPVAFSRVPCLCGRDPDLKTCSVLVLNPGPPRYHLESLPSEPSLPIHHSSFSYLYLYFISWNWKHNLVNTIFMKLVHNYGHKLIHKYYVSMTLILF